MTTSSHRVIATIIIIITGVATGGTVTGITTATGESFGPQPPRCADGGGQAGWPQIDPAR
jgi:hypothetical protein